jgi:hypothetical protein
LTSFYANKHFYLVSFIHFLSVLQYEYNYVLERINDQMAPLISRHIHASIAVEDPGTCAAILAAVQHLRKQLGRVVALRMPHVHTAQNCDNSAASPRSRVGPGLGGGGSFGCARCCNFGRRRKVALQVVDSFDDAYSDNAAAVEPDNRTAREFVTTRHRVNLGDSALKVPADAAEGRVVGKRLQNQRPQRQHAHNAHVAALHAGGRLQQPSPNSSTPRTSQSRV